MDKRYKFMTIEGYRTANPRVVIKHEEVVFGFGENIKEAKKQVFNKYLNNNVTLTKLKRIL